MDERLYWIWLAETLGQGSPWAPLLVRRYGGAKAVYEGAADDMEPDGEIGKEAAAAIHERLRRRSLERAGEIAAPEDSFLVVYEVEVGRTTFLDAGERMTAGPGRVFLTTLPQ